MNTYSDITSDGGYDPRNVLHKALDPLIGDMKQDEHGEVYVYTGSEWRRVVTPEKQAVEQEQEPVSWMFVFEDGEYDPNITFDSKEQGEKWLESDDCLWDGSIAPVYAAPVSTKDLTHEEKAEIVSAHYPSVYRIIDAAIAAFKEKNK